MPRTHGGIYEGERAVEALRPCPALDDERRVEGSSGSRSGLDRFSPQSLWRNTFRGEAWVPGVIALAMPVMVPTGEFPALGLPAWRFGLQPPYVSDTPICHAAHVC
jgi:hypothetical protein